jgi:hypothetical protein
MRAIQADKLDHWEHITFNPESGKLQIITEVLFKKSKADYHGDPPPAEFFDVETARAVLGEIASLYKIFRMPFQMCQMHKKPYTSKGTAANNHEAWLLDLAMTRAQKMIDELAHLGVPVDAMKPGVEFTERTTVMQYCQMQVKFKHISFDSNSKKIGLKTGVAWQKRLYSRDQQDIPDAQFAEPETARKILSEVAKIVKFYGNDLDVVIHTTFSAAYDDEHKQWLDELLDNRADRVKDELVGLGLEDEKIQTRVDSIEDGQEAEGLGLHFQLIQEMRATSTTGLPKGPDHVLDVQSCGVYDFNGRYKPAGTNNGETKYRHMSGGKHTVTRGNDGFWYLCMNHDTKQGVYKCRDLCGPEPWKHCSTGGSGLVPEIKRIQLHDGSPDMKEEKNSVSFRMG